MLRLLRRYNKALLVVGGVLLMVAWAIGGTISQLAGQSAMTGRVWATVGGSDVRGSELMEVQAEMRVLEVLGADAIPIPGAAKDSVHYFLLRREAMDSGLVGTPDDGLRSLSAQLASARSVNPEVPSVEDFVGRVAAISGQPPQVVLRTISVANGINRLVALYDGAPRLSDRRLRRSAADLFTAIDADYVVLDARRLSRDLDWTPSEEALAAHLDRYGEFAPGTGAAYAYRLPNRLKLEWMVVSADAVRAALANSEKLGNIELRKHRDRNTALFPKPIDGSDDFEVIREALKQNRLATLLDEELASISKFAVDRLQMPLRAIPREGVYLRLPPDWDQRKTNFEDLASEIAQQYGVARPAWSTSGPNWIEVREVDRLPGLEGAIADRFGTGANRLSQLVAQLREFGGSDSYALQVGVVGPPLRKPNGDLVFWRVIDADPSRAPRSVDEVRDRVVADVKAIEQFNRLVAEMPGLKDQARREGLLSVAGANQSNLESARGVRESSPAAAAAGRRLPSPLPGIGASAEAIRRMVQQAAALPSGVPIEEVPESDRLFAIDLPDRLMVMVGRITGVTPMSSEDFETLTSTSAMGQLVFGPQALSLREELFSRSALEARLGFRLAREFAEDEVPTDAQPQSG